MLKYTFILISGFMLSFIGNAAVKSKLVTKLSSFEAFEGQEFHNGLLFVGKRAMKNAPHRVDVYSKNGTKKLTTITLNHNIAHMVSYGKKGVLISGVRFNKRYSSHLTTLELAGNQIKKRSVQLSSQLLVNYPAVNGREVFVTNIGERKVHSSKNGIRRSLKTLAKGISFPGPSVYQDGYLWIIEKRGPELGNESIVKVYPRTGKVVRITGKVGLLGAEQITAMPKQNLIAVTERGGEQISFYSTKTDKLVSIVSVSSVVQGIDRYGHCAVAVDPWNKQMVFVATEGPNAFEMVDLWDLSIAGEDEHYPRAVTVDELTSTFYTRSFFPCGVIGKCTKHNAVYSYNDAQSKAKSLCFDK